MTESFFLSQIERLKERFGPKSFDWQFVRVVGAEVSAMPDESFRRSVDNWIGGRKTNNPPLLQDFRDAKIAHEKGRFTNEVKKAATVFNYGLKDVLKKHYNVDTLSEAMELERLKIKLGGANDDGGVK